MVCTSVKQQASPLSAAGCRPTNDPNDEEESKKRMKNRPDLLSDFFAFS
jgi:hypothetical protein